MKKDIAGKYSKNYQSKNVLHILNFKKATACGNIGERALLILYTSFLSTAFIQDALF